VVAIEDRETITAASLPREITSPPKKESTQPLIPPSFNLTSHLEDLSRKYITEARILAGGNLRKTASLLGISYRSLRHLIEKYGLRESERPERAEPRPEMKPLL
jgi:DNA-binding NtrC family response regulator